MAHPIQQTALRLLGDKPAFDAQSRADLMLAYLATNGSDQLDDATRALIELSSALKQAGRAQAALTLGMLVMSCAPMLRKKAAAQSTARTERAAASARKLTGTPSIQVSSGPPPAGAIKASPLARFTAMPTTREDEQP